MFLVGGLVPLVSVHPVRLPAAGIAQVHGAATAPACEARRCAEPAGGREALRRHRELPSSQEEGKRSEQLVLRRSGTATTPARRSSSGSRSPSTASCCTCTPTTCRCCCPGIVCLRRTLPARRWASSRIGAFFGSIGGAFLIRWFGSRYVGTLLATLGVVATAVIGVAGVKGNPTASNVVWRSASWLACRSMACRRSCMQLLPIPIPPRCVARRGHGPDRLANRRRAAVRWWRQQYLGM